MTLICHYLDDENEPITPDDSSDEEGKTTRPRQLQLRRRHAASFTSIARTQ